MSKSQKIRELLEYGLKPKEISEKLGVSVGTVYNAKSKAKKRGAGALAIRKPIDIEKYEPELINIIKNINLKVANILLNKDLKKASPQMLSTTLGTLIDKLRVMEGKSTENIAHNVIHSLDDKQLDIVKKAIKSLKESMLSS